MSTLLDAISVLRVSDDPDASTLLSAALERRAGTTVEAAASVSDVLDQLEAGNVDCVVSDYELPDGDGIELLRRVRDVDSDLPFVLFPDDGSDAVAAEAFAAGADGYLPKDSVDDQYTVLADRVGRLVDGRRATHEAGDDAHQQSWFHTVVEALDDPVYVLSETGRFEFVNDAFVETFGYDREEVIGADTSIIKSPEAVEEGEDYLGRILSSDGPESIRFEVEIEAKDGRSIPCEDHMGVLPYEGEFFEGSVGMLRDATDRKRRETELQRRNERLGEFASVVSHDLRNPLNIAKGRTELAREECDSDHLDAVSAAHERMEALIDDMLVLAREGDTVGDEESVDIGRLAQACYGTVETGDATIETETDRAILADRSRLRQLLENLFRNAVEHAGDDITITVGELDDGTGFYVEDDGPGIPADARDDVFEPGYSTTEDGTGFGLAIVRQIAEAHGWEIRATEGTAGGARFEITGVEFVA